MIDKRNVSLNLNVRGLKPSATLRINAAVRARRAAGQPVFNLGLGQSPFPVPEHVVEALRANAAHKDYLPVEGLPALREAVAEHHRKKDRVDALAEEVLIGPGSKELLFLLQLCFYGELIVPTPCWVSYTPQSEIVGRNVRFIPTSSRAGWKVRPERMVETFEADHDRYRPRLMVLNYPANPTGVTYTAGELQEIAKVAREYEVLLLSDEIYSGLHYTGDHVSVARYYPEGTIIANGISKWCGAGGWRLGTFRFPPDLDWLMETMAAVASETYTTVSAPIQDAAVEAFRGSLAMEHYLSHARRVLHALAKRGAAELQNAGAKVVMPGGAFYLFPHFREHRSALGKRGIKHDRQLAERLMADTGVATIPGSEFARESSELYLRMSLVDFDGAAALARSEGIPLDEGLPREFVDQAAGNITEAMAHIGRWLNG